ncbi:carbonic anhydrase [Jannaschia aquimarina]|uniref:Carbonic anhydrase n=1 Tax=Jannaschia aquimarina TaxID=935700 RepID=A0A0D1EMS0_9RHOB|nr:carbonic anhydrase [Jannaschia aquimarina]KIT16990.1 Carbonic anhydrase 1 [Jannaschia aquimarina]SNS80962.1 carbonic anhydrase [Jannaschia aquimarina]
MKHASPLPPSLIQRYHGWKATTYAQNAAWYRRLAAEGQRPRAMIIACCDSRVHVTSIFGAEQGEFFIHRNIAGLVPSHDPGAGQHGTSAAVEYAVTGLHVSQIIVVGHSRCGGVAACAEMCEGAAPELDDDDSYVGRWMDILRPGYESVKDLDLAIRPTALEKRAVLVSLENLMTFPFVAAAVEAGDLALHGLWNDISSGVLEAYDPAADAFVAL